MKPLPTSIIIIFYTFFAFTTYGQTGGECEGHEGQTGGFIAKDGSLHDHPGGPNEGTVRGGGGGRGQSAGQSSSGRNTAGQQSQNTIAVTINGKTFNVSKQVQKNLNEFLSLYKTNGDVGSLVSAFGGLLNVFGLSNQKTTIEINDAIVTISAPSTFSRAWRAQTLAFIDAQLTPSNINKEEGKMWQHLRNIIRNPEKYEDGGIQKDDKGKVILRDLPGERYRGIAGEFKLTSLDIQHIGLVYNALKPYTGAMDYLAISDIAIGVFKDTLGGRRLSSRDEMLLNKGLLTLPDQYKQFLQNQFNLTATMPNHNSQLWLKLIRYLNNEIWDQRFEVRDAQVWIITDRLDYLDEDPDYNDEFWNDVRKSYNEIQGRPVRHFPGPSIQGKIQNSWSFYWQGGY